MDNEIDIYSRNSYYRSMKSVVSEKGQVTIPKKCRNSLGIRPGTVLEFSASEGRLTAVKLQQEDVLHKWRGKGHLPGSRNVDDYLREIRG
jgi:AbrB family looped-hinge helix DNA binding protein